MSSPTFRAAHSSSDEETKIRALYQNTPAQFHGRPELVQKMTEELQQLLS
jgi:hypothetical protein